MENLNTECDIVTCKIFDDEKRRDILNIFLSHNCKDKPIVGQIAIRLKEIYGEESVFYDSWSIQPGEGIIDKMNEGLLKADFFFFFISKNSLASSMVKLEWQNALMMKTQDHKLKFIPVRLDESSVPAILKQTLYIDFYTNGFEAGIRQIFDVVSDSNTYKTEFKEFENLCAYREKIGSDGLCERLTVKATYFMEPTAQFLVLVNSTKEDVIIAPGSCISDGFFLSGEPHPLFPSMQKGVLLPVGVSRALTKENPFVFDIKVKHQPEMGANIIMSIVHTKGPNSRKVIPLVEKTG